MAFVIRRHIVKLLRRAFEAAGGGPRWPTPSAMWAPSLAALNAQPRIAARANFTAANNPTGERIAALWSDNLIGDGPSARSQHPNEAVRTALEDIFATFYSRAGTDGLDFCAVLRLGARALVVDGETLILFVTTPRGELRLRVLPARQLDNSINRETAGGEIVAGIEFNSAGERVAYWILPDLLDSPLTRPAVRVPAEDVVHLYEPKFPGQVRGLSWLTPVLTLLSELDKLQDALAARMSTAALFGAFVTDVDGTAFGDASPKIGDKAELSLEPGIVRILPPGASIQFPTVPDIDGAPQFLTHLLRSIGAGVGLPYELLAGDLSQVNYSSAKAGFSQFYRRVKAIRALIGSVLLDRVWQRVVTLEILSGRLSAPDFATNADDYFASTFLFPQPESLDALKETQADVMAINAGIASRAQIIAERGRDIADVQAEIDADTFRPIQSASPAALTTGA
jgi:lambda family phage portal protein